MAGHPCFAGRRCIYAGAGSIAYHKERMAKKLVRKSEHELWAEPRFHDTYELVCFQLSNTGVFRYFTFFKRKDSILKVKEAENEACKGLE